MSHSINSWSASHETNESNIPWASHENPIETTIEPPVFSCDPPLSTSCSCCCARLAAWKNSRNGRDPVGNPRGYNGNKMGCNRISWLFNGKSWDRMVDNIGYFLVSNGVFFLGYNGIQRDFMDSMGCNGDIFNEYHWSFHGVGISCVKIPMEILWAFFEA